MSKQEKMAAAPAAYVDALTNNDLEAIVSLYADNAVVEDPVGSEPHRGIDAIRDFYAGLVKYNLKAELSGPIRMAGDEVAFPFNCDNPVAGVTLNIIDVFKFDDTGKVVSMRAFWGKANATPL